MDTPGAKILALRIDQGLTQEQLAARSGVTSMTISNLENPKQNTKFSPRLSTLEKIATGLGVDVGRLFADDANHAA